MTIKITKKDITKEYELEDLQITGVSTDEKEITVQASADADKMYIFTSDNVWLTKIKKKVLANPKDWKITNIEHAPDGQICGVFVEAPKDLLSLRTQKTERGPYDEATKERFAQFLNNNRAKN